MAKLRQACLAILESRAAEVEEARLARLAEERAREHAATMELLNALEMVSARPSLTFPSLLQPSRTFAALRLATASRLRLGKRDD